MNVYPGSDFDLALFKEPPADNRVVYSWNWNAPISRQGIDERLDGFVKAGIKGLYILPLPIDFRPERLRTFMHPEYLSEEFFELVRYAHDGARARGITVWIYDEGGWPSGGACGNTVRQNPDARLQKLASRSVTLTCDQRYHPCEGFVALFDGKRRLHDDYIASRTATLTEYYLEDDTVNGNRIDGTSETAIDTFINNTYEAYKSALGEELWSRVPLVFTDEPGLNKTTIAKGLFDKFYAEYGYDLRDFIYVIEGDGEQAVSEEEVRARIDWVTLTGKLFRQNTFEKLRDWCAENGVQFSGHVDLDNRPWGGVSKGYFSLVDILRTMHVPGIDVIWEQIRYPYDGNAVDDETRGFGHFPRLAASAARVEGRNLALTETFSIYGDGVSPDEMKFALNYQAIRGINVFNVLGLPYGKDRCAALMMRPAFCPEKPGFNNLRHINEYYARLSYLLTLGHAEGDTALYMPCRDYAGAVADRDDANVSFKLAGTALEKKNIPFDIIDDKCIRDASDTGDGLKLGDAIYRHVVVPTCRRMPDDVAKKIANYLGEGEPIYTPNSDNVRVLTRKLCKSRLVFLFNEGLLPVCENLNFEDSNAYLIDPATARITAAPKSVTLACGDIAVLLVGEDELPCECNDFEHVATIEKFTPVRYEQTVISYEGVRLHAHEGAPGSLESFSGTIFYEADCPVDGKAGEIYRVALGDTSVSATLLIDGEYLCDLGMSPMVAYVPADRFTKGKRITVALSNTAADEIIAKSDVIKSHPKAEVGGYTERMTVFESRRHRLHLGTLTIERQNEA